MRRPAPLPRAGIAGDFGPNDHYQYYRYETGQFHIIPWDMDGTWDDTMANRSIFQNFQRLQISAIIQNNPELRARYKEKIGQIINTSMLPVNVEPRIDFIYNQIRDAVYADPYKQYTNEQFDWGPDSLKLFAQLRRQNLQVQIAQP